MWRDEHPHDPLDGHEISEGILRHLALMVYLERCKADGYRREMARRKALDEQRTAGLRDCWKTSPLDNGSPEDQAREWDARSDEYEAQLRREGK